MKDSGADRLSEVTQATPREPWVLQSPQLPTYMDDVSECLLLSVRVNSTGGIGIVKTA